MFFNSWYDLGRILVAGVLGYASLILLLRVSGKRTLSKMNAFDFIVTVAFGSVLATILLSKDVSLSEGVLALALLVGLQYVVTWLSVRSETIQHLIKAQPALLVYRGEFLRHVMKSERVTEEEVHAAMRQQGLAEMQDILAVVIETDGSLTVVSQAEERAGYDAFSHVAHFRPEKSHQSEKRTGENA
jgi:uncharacterized membrane protein YcaP (DUF421 family)